MKTKKISRTILSGFILLLAALSLCPVVTAQEMKQQALQQPLREVIGIDGRIMPSTDGSFDASGYKMTYGADGAPVFTPYESDEVGVWAALGSGVSGPVTAIAVSGNDVYVVGSFTTAGGNPATSIAKWDGASWSALGSGLNSWVYAIAVSGNDVYAGGEFTTAGGIPIKNIAKWDGTSWSALGSGVNNLVWAIAVSGNDVYVGGGFTTAGGNPAGGIAKWDGTNWSALGSGVNSWVISIAVNGNDVYAGGNFTTAGGNPIRGIAKWDGTNWSALGAGVNATVNSIAVNGNDVYAGGNFTAAGVIAASKIAKWDGTNWSALGSGLNGGVETIAVRGNDLYVGGSFTTAGGNPSSRIAKWDGASWSPLGSGVNNSVWAIAVSWNDVYVGGFYTTAGGNPASRIAKWNIILPPPAPHSLVSGIPVLGSIQLDWTDSSANEDGFIIERNVNSPFWSVLDTVGANTTSFVDNGLTTGDTYFYRVYAYNPQGNSGYTNITHQYMQILPLPPHSLALTIPDTGRVRLTWSDSSNNETGFVLERRDNIDTSWTVRDTTDANITQFNDSNLIVSRTYDWRVYAYNELGNSPYSNIVSSLITSITHSGSIPGEYALHQNYPNPFNPVTKIQYDIPKQGIVTVKIFDILGREVATLVNEIKDAGRYGISWNAGGLGSGIYFYRLEAGEYSEVRRMLMIK